MIGKPMRRREFVSLLGGAAAAWPLAGRAQQSGKVWRIGFILGASPPELFGKANMAGFINGMQELGYVGGRDYVVEWRTALGDYERFPEIAAELVRLKVDVIVMGISNQGAMRAVRQATSTIPIIMTGAADPVGSGFVASLARPGGNVTGLATSQDDSSPKQLELLATAVPGIKRIGLLIYRGTTTGPVAKNVQAVGNKVDLDIVTAEARDADDVDRAFATLRAERVGAVLVVNDAVFFVQRQRIVDLALRYKLPTMFALREYVEAGGLMSYGASDTDAYRRGGLYVGRILKGAKPSDLPVDLPTRYELVINLATAKALRLEIPAKLLALADEVLE